MKIFVAAVEVLRKKERGYETQFTTKIGGKTTVCPSYFILENFIPSYTWLCRNWPFSPPNRLTLRITLICKFVICLKSRKTKTNMTNL